MPILRMEWLELMISFRVVLKCNRVAKLIYLSYNTKQSVEFFCFFLQIALTLHTMQLRSITLLLCLMAVLCSAFPQTVSEAEARAMAGRFFSAHSSAVRSRSWSETQLTQVLPEGISTPYIYKGVNGEFVLVSKMNRENPIVGYGDAMGEEKLPAEVASLMSGLNTAKSKVFLESGASVKPVQHVRRQLGRNKQHPFRKASRLLRFYQRPENQQQKRQRLTEQERQPYAVHADPGTQQEGAEHRKQEAVAEDIDIRKP